MWKKLKQLTWDWRGVVFTVPTVTLLIIAMRFAGWLQPLELAVLDAFFQLRPLESPDQRILIVGLKESDIQKLGWPVSDKILATLLTKIKLQNPRVIGLDFYRDVPVIAGHEELVKIFKTTPNVFGVEKVTGDSFNSQIASPSVLKQLNQVTASDFVVDEDGVVRRSILFANENLQSLGLALALKYLEQQGITPTSTDNGFMKVGQTVFAQFNANDGGYMRADSGGYQILLNFRGLARSFLQVSFTDVLEDRLARDLLRDRIVLIGPQAQSINDKFYTPYSRRLLARPSGIISTPIRTDGVEIHANIASQIVSSVLDNRTLIKVLSEPLQDIWIVLGSLVIATLTWQMRYTARSRNFSTEFIFKTVIAGTLTGACLISSSYLAFLFGWWIPVAAPLLALCGSTLASTGYIYVSKLRASNMRLEGKLEETNLLCNELNRVNKQLKSKNEELEKALHQLNKTAVNFPDSTCETD